MSAQTSAVAPTYRAMFRASQLLALMALLMARPCAAAEPGQDRLDENYATNVRPIIKKYCLHCHSTKAKKGSLDLERFSSARVIRQDLKPWQTLVEQIEAGEMPPNGQPQLTPADKKRLLGWVRSFLDAEAHARAGDPGHVPLRRLSNAEYDNTIRDLTGVDLRPTREFPADGAAGEGFTNAAEALTDMSPALLTKYLNAAKEVSDHVVLLPDGFRFSPTRTRRDWSNESVARLRAFYQRHAPANGALPLEPYLTATVRYRKSVLAGSIGLDGVAAKEGLNGKYFRTLWQTLIDTAPSFPLDLIRQRWRRAEEKDVPGLAAEVASWQAVLWQSERIGNYIRPVGSGYAESTSWQIANDPLPTTTIPLRLKVNAVPGQSEVVISLDTRDLLAVDTAARVVWQRPRFEAAGKPPLLLKDYAQFGPAYEVDYPRVFADTAKYLAAAQRAANDTKLTVGGLAQSNGLDAAFLQQWIELLAVKPLKTTVAERDAVGTPVPFAVLHLLDEKTENVGNKAWIKGWRKKGADLPSLVTNASDTVELIPGRAAARGVMVHPTPGEFAGVTWKSPFAGRVRIAARIAHAHPACGNGIAWWLEGRRGGRALAFADGTLDLGKEAKTSELTLPVEKGDLLMLAVDARDGNHSCDLTEIALTVTEMDKQGRVWNLAADIADSVLAGNPHADKYKNVDTWSFVRGPSRPLGKRASALIPADSVLGSWRDAASDPRRQAEATKLADQVQSLLSGNRPMQASPPNRALYDNLVTGNSVLFTGVDLARLSKTRDQRPNFGLPKGQFGTGVHDGDVVVAANSTTQIRLPAHLFVGREFVVEGSVDAIGKRVVTCQVHVGAAGADVRWDGKIAVIAVPTGAGYQRLLHDLNSFRQCFPRFVCYPQVIPTDEVVTLKMYHREDEPLQRLFLDAEAKRELERLWQEHRFISRQPVAENAYLQQFIGFVTQDQPQSMVAYFEGQRPTFKKRAEDFLRDEQAAVPKQLDALLEFAGRAYRRPLVASEKSDLLSLYHALRRQGTAHDEALRGMLMRILVSPAFLFRLEVAPSGPEPKPVNDWELAVRLSYFLWSTAPDDTLRRLAAAGQLSNPTVLAAQTRRLILDPRVRSLAIEFGTQWLHVRGFDELKEKNEKLFPTFNADLRKAIYEESILFFQDLFQSDRAVTHVLEAEYTFLNETLAKHYGIPGVVGQHWRRVDGVRRYGRGGVLGLASVQARQAGASRTSPILRGNWVVETLLGEKLPRPPAEVPKLPDEEGGADKLTMRQQVEKHTSVESCAVCHARIDPFGFALENYDAIGRFRSQDSGGLPIDARAKLKDNTVFAGIDGLRGYLLAQKKNEIVRLFCRRLLGYALGRAVTLSDTALLDDMVAELNKNAGRISAAVLTIVRSQQFRMIRGSGTTE